MLRMLSTTEEFEKAIPDILDSSGNVARSQSGCAGSGRIAGTCPKTAMSTQYNFPLYCTNCCNHL